MNERFRHDFRIDEPGTTTAAEGMRRRAFTVAEIEAMVQAGIIPEHERFELIGGEVVPMSPKGSTHENVKGEINAHLQRTVPDDLRILPETTLRLDETSFLEPDFCVFARSVSLDRLRGPDVLLAIEVSDSSLQYDTGRKIGIYAAYGIAEVWVIDAKRLVTRVHRTLGVEGYREVFEVAAGEDLVCVRRSEVRLNLFALGLTPISE
ncbi:MAG: Uma2 family endonuclease [Pseudomonadota bacterium]